MTVKVTIEVNPTTHVGRVPFLWRNPTDKMVYLRIFKKVTEENSISDDLRVSDGSFAFAAFPGLSNKDAWGYRLERDEAVTVRNAA